MACAKCRKTNKKCLYLPQFQCCERCRHIGHQHGSIPPGTKSDDDIPRSPYKLSSLTPSIIDKMMHNGAASNYPDRVEDPAAVLCHRSDTGRVSQPLTSVISRRSCPSLQTNNTPHRQNMAQHWFIWPLGGLSFGVCLRIRYLVILLVHFARSVCTCLLVSLKDGHRVNIK